MTGLQRVASRLAAAGLLALLVAAIWFMGVRPLIDHVESLDDSIERTATLLARTRAIARQRGETQRDLDQVRADPRISAVVMKAPTLQLAAAELQERIKRWVETAGGGLRSAQVLPARDEGGFRRVVLRVTLDIDVEGLQRTFHAIETAAPYLILDNVEIRGRQLRVAAAGRRAPDLSVAFDVVGFMPGPGS